VNSWLDENGLEIKEDGIPRPKVTKSSEPLEKLFCPEPQQAEPGKLMPVDPYASGVLFGEHHDRIVANISKYATDAGIQPRWIWTKLADTCGPDAIDYVRRFNKHRASEEVRGVCMLRKKAGLGEEPADPEKQMSAITGALVRNFINARMMFGVGPWGRTEIRPLI
jgi:hypothetical protein